MAHVQIFESYPQSLWEKLVSGLYKVVGGLWKVLTLKPKYKARREGTSHVQSVVPTCVHPHYDSKVHLGKLHGTTHHTCTFIYDTCLLSHQIWKCYVSFITVIQHLWDLLLASGHKSSCEKLKKIKTSECLKLDQLTYKIKYIWWYDPAIPLLDTYRDKWRQFPTKIPRHRYEQQHSSWYSQLKTTYMTQLVIQNQLYTATKWNSFHK